MLNVLFPTPPMSIVSEVAGLGNAMLSPPLPWLTSTRDAVKYVSDRLLLAIGFPVIVTLLALEKLL